MRFPELQRAKLSNGLEIVLAERHSVPVVELQLLFDPGYAADQFGGPGPAALVLNALHRGPADLPGHTIATVEGSTSESYLHQQGIATVGLPDIESAVEAVIGGTAKAVVYDAPILHHLAQTDFRSRIDSISVSFEQRDYAFGLPPSSPLREAINRELLVQTHSRSWDRTVRGYLGEQQ